MATKAEAGATRPRTKGQEQPQNLQEARGGLCPAAFQGVCPVDTFGPKSNQ